MDEEMREAMVTTFVEAMHNAGAENYEEGLAKVVKLIEIVHGWVVKIQTVEGLRATVAEMQPMSREEESIAPFLFRNLLAVVGLLVRSGANALAADLPAFPAGRPHTLSVEEIQELLDYISGLHRRGTNLTVAKVRASQRYSCSVRTVERLWAERHTVPAQEFKAEDVLKLFAK